jgi:hypothetical protein
MSDSASPSPKTTTWRSVRVRVLVATGSVAALIGAGALATVGDAQSTKKAPAFVRACTQRTGPKESVGDLNIKKSACAKGQKPLNLALYPVAAAQGPPGPQGPQGPPGPSGGLGNGSGSTAEYALANVLVSRGGADPKIWATYSATMGSPIGTTTGGQFRFTCSPQQAPCKVSIAAAVLSSKSGAALVHARLLIYKDNGTGTETYCEYADGSSNSGTPAAIDRVPLDTRVVSINDPLNMGIGGSLDCGAGQPYSPIVKEIWVPRAPTPDNAAYDVWATFSFK